MKQKISSMRSTRDAFGLRLSSKYLAQTDRQRVHSTSNGQSVAMSFVARLRKRLDVQCLGAAASRRNLSSQVPAACADFCQIAVKSLCQVSLVHPLHVVRSMYTCYLQSCLMTVEHQAHSINSLRIARMDQLSSSISLVPPESCNVCGGKCHTNNQEALCQQQRLWKS